MKKTRLGAAVQQGGIKIGGSGGGWKSRLKCVDGCSNRVTVREIALVVFYYSIIFFASIARMDIHVRIGSVRIYVFMYLFGPTDGGAVRRPRPRAVRIYLFIFYGPYVPRTGSVRIYIFIHLFGPISGGAVPSGGGIRRPRPRPVRIYMLCIYKKAPGGGRMIERSLVINMCDV